ncbi:hypothetical protein MP638_006958, partial [Amoeboaphelidium occidentale]
MEMSYLLLIHNAAQVVQVCSKKEQFKAGHEMNDISILKNASIVVSMDGRIAAVEKSDVLAELDWFKSAKFERTINAEGKAILPGFIDGHTHPVWSGDRVHEYELKIQGATYMGIHKAGGGIGFTVKHTKESSEKELLDGLINRLERMVKQGTTCIEAKSGYGLEAETEMKMLKVLHKARELHPMDISATFLGAHSIPKGSTLPDACKNVLNEQIPELIALKKDGQISVENIDVFHEKGVFETDETRRILVAGKEAGLSINFHGDELHPMASAELGGELGARAISHLEEISDAGIKTMAKKNIFGVLLPTTAYVLRIKPPPARKMIEAGVPVALGSDFNPNAHCLSMPFVMNLACGLMRMTLKEALVASTINAAASLNRSETHGSIEVGKRADLVILDHGDWRHVIYEMVDPPIAATIINGKAVYE